MRKFCYGYSSLPPSRTVALAGGGSHPPDLDHIGIGLVGLIHTHPSAIIP